MGTLQTVIPPLRQDTLRRSRLVEHVHQNVHKALTLVAAPAGYGKTSLLVDACHELPYPTCWLSLDESDRDVCNFVTRLVAAIRQHFPGFGAPTMQAITADPNLGRDPAALGAVLAQDLAQNVPEFFILVLDDYHLLDRQASIGDLLEIILKRDNHRRHVIIASRAAPGNLPSIHLIAQGKMAFVGQDALAFKGDEVRQALKKMHHLDLTPEQADDLAQESEGWIAGILLATAFQSGGMRDALAQAKQQRGPFYAYLADQVFEQQPPPLQQTMLKLSTLAEMDDDACARILGVRGAGVTLEELGRRGLFVTTITDQDGGAPHYRFHHLFRDFLQERLYKQDHELFCKLHGQAAAYFESREQWAYAVIHRRAAGDPRATAQTMERGVKAMYISRRLETILFWYEDVPPTLRPEFPRLLLYVARAMFDLGQTDETIPLLRQAEAAFRERGETDQVLSAMQQRATVRCVQGRHTESLDIARESLAAQEISGLNFPVLTAEAHRLIGLACLRLGHSQKAVEHLRGALDLHQELGRREAAVTCLDLSVAYIRLGQLSEGGTCQDRAIELYRSLGPSGELALVLNNVACERHYLAGDYARALELLREALDVARQVGSLRAQIFVLLSMADLYRDLGALQDAREGYAQAEELAQQSGQMDLLNFVLVGSALALAQGGDAVGALGLAAQARDQARRREDVYQLGLACLALGDIHLQAGDALMALDEIQRGSDLLEQSGARRELTRAYMLLARAHQAAGEVEAALEALKQALNVGIETQTFHYLVIEGRRVFELFKRLLQQNPGDRRPAQVMDRVRALPAVARALVGAPTAPTLLPSRSALRFYGLGPGRAEKDGQPVAWNSAQARYLVFYLLAHSSRSREQIFETFWPDAELKAARSAFHGAKYRARRALERQFIVHEDGLYRLDWDPDCWFDASAFEALLDGREGERQARLEQAVALYQGDFLENYDAQWLLPLRERLRLRYRDALLELGELYTARGELARARAALGHAVELDDFYEPAVRALMRLHALEGQRRQALDVFSGLEQRLRDQRALPGKETLLLRRDIQANFSTPQLVAAPL